MERMECPICGQLFAQSLIAAHADRCLDKTDVGDAQFRSDVCYSTVSKRPRFESAAACAQRCSSPVLFDSDFQFAETDRISASVVPATDGASSCQTSAQSAQSTPTPNQSPVLEMQPISVNETTAFGRNTNATGVWGIFSGSQKSVQLKGSKSNKGLVKRSVVPSSTLQSDVELVNIENDNTETKPAADMSDTVKESVSTVASKPYSFTAKLSSKSSAMSPSVPLAERMRPTMLADFVGQGHIVGSQRPLRSLLESTSVSSMVLWGPPGCGKVSALLVRP